MKKCNISISLILIITYIFVTEAVKKDVCEKCVKIEDCPKIANLPTEKRKIWLKRFPCMIFQKNKHPPLFDVSTVAKRDHICCPNSNVLKIVHHNGNTPRPNSYEYQQTRQKRQIQQSEVKDQNINVNPVPDQVNKGNENKTASNTGPYYPNQQSHFESEVTLSGHITQNTQYLQVPQQQNLFFNNGDGNSFGIANSGAQCTEQTSLLPEPRTGCCGQDMSDSSSITDLQSILNIFAPVNLNNWANQPHQLFRRRRSAESMTDDNALDDRIAGGKETELDEFPWTVLLKITFTFGGKRASFNCGGSLISSKYVLTAGHCLNEDGGTIVDIELTLAEYDKSQFPRDCKSGLGERNCIDNILMHAKNVILHPQYDDESLQNDIALIELDGYAPYTRYIRPICIPPINVDDPEFSNLPLAVAGWGRIGRYLTDIKQSTVVHLVHHDECVQSYPYLTETQLCAAGRTGEDTCKGDSGGPLMLLYRQNYYVVGVVSGKRADSPCGTSVPTLYTNVFHYVPWIQSVIN
ncbi:CLIP domain-containing serine protease HP8-like [Nymphalis io]|uniref:CLIP domain-containing serine protease HP8-like n=1 Tax=Inachis io TaxID=171585 RepID=UPI002167C23D|nr:CLIP domain-containing serine protease HP8-like [Nymphalis io]